MDSLNSLPEPCVLHIFSYLTPNDMARLCQCCKDLRTIASDEILWRSFFHRHFRISPYFRDPMVNESWRSEYIRLTDEIPIVEAEVLTAHTDQVLHVSFSHDGKRFATTAKDANVNVWKSTHPVQLEYQYSMKRFSWKYTQFSQFNESDTLLLVSGVLFGLQSTSGEIIIFGLDDGFTIRTRVRNKPYDIFGGWYSDFYFFTGDLKWLGSLVSRSVISLHIASQEIQSEYAATVNPIYKLYNPKASTVRSLLVANCVEPSSEQSPEPPNHCKVLGNDHQEFRQQTMNASSSHFTLPAESDLININSRGMRGTLQGAFQNWRPIDNVSDIGYTTEFRNKLSRARDRDRCQVDDGNITDGQLPCNSRSVKSSDGENETKFGESPMQGEPPESSEGSAPECESACEPGQGDDDKLKQDFGNNPKSHEEKGGNDAVIDPREKWLIFTNGSKTYTPHQIGFKRISPFAFDTVMDIGTTLRERWEEYRRRKSLQAQGIEVDEPQENIDYSNYERVKDMFDTVDHVIDLHGHIIGMTLSPDHRFLYVNSRPWPSGYSISDPLTPPPIAQEIDIHVIDMVTLREVGLMRRAHRAYTANDECFFIFLDASEYYLASGAEDKFGYLWDRFYGISLTKVPHTDVVNAVAFNPADSEMLVTVSDDHTIKIWRSKRQCRELNIDYGDLTQGTRLYLKPRPSFQGCSSTL